VLSDTALVLDHGSHIFVWLGAQVGSVNDSAINSEVVNAACRHLVGSLAEGRFPVPEVRYAAEVSPLSARMP
jgi:Gelsolin repeat